MSGHRALALALVHAGPIAALDLILYYGWFVVANPAELFVIAQPEQLLGRHLVTGLVAGGIGSLVYLSAVAGLRLLLRERYVQPPSRLVWEILLVPTVAVVFATSTLLSPRPVPPGVAGMISASLLATHALMLVTADWAAYALTRLALGTAQGASVLVVTLLALALTRPGPAPLDRPLVSWSEDLPALLVACVAVLVGGLALGFLGNLAPALAVPPQWWQISITAWSWYFMGGATLHYLATGRMPAAESLMLATLGEFLVLLLVPFGMPALARGARKLLRRT